MADRWVIHGTEFENCPCAWGCPCQFGAKSTHGRCEAFMCGHIEQGNFNDYRILRIDEMPSIEAHMIPSAEDYGGIGEPGTSIVQPAVANAVFAATGVQLTRMPIDAALIAKAV